MKRTEGAEGDRDRHQQSEEDREAGRQRKKGIERLKAARETDRDRREKNRKRDRPRERYTEDRDK